MAGKPLFHHILTTLLDVLELDEILVDTDSPVILKGLEEHFPDVKTILGPENLCGDEIPMFEILLNDTGIYEADYYLQTHSTNPLLRAETISNVIQKF